MPAPGAVVAAMVAGVLAASTVGIGAAGAAGTTPTLAVEAAAQQGTTEVAGADSGDERPEPVPLQLVSQSPVVPATGTFVARIDLGPILGAADRVAPEGVDLGGGQEPGVGLEVAVTVHSRLDDPDDLAGQPISPINRRPVRPLSELPVDNGVLRLEMPIRSSEPFDEVERVRIPDPGVYPVSVEVRRDDVLLGSVVLHLIRLPGGPGPPVPATDTASPTRSTASPTRRLALVLGIGRPGGMPVGDAIGVLQAQPDVPVTTVLAPGVLRVLEGNGVLAASFADALAGRPVATAAEPRLDPSALAAIGQGDLFSAAATATSSRVVALGLEPAIAVAVVGAPLSQAGAQLVAGTGAAVVIDLDGAPAEPPWPDAAVSSPSWVAERGSGPVGLIRPVAADPGRTSEGEDDGETAVGSIRTTGGPVAVAHRELARLMMADPEDPAVIIGGFAGGTGGDGVDPLADAAVLTAFVNLLTQVAVPSEAARTGSPDDDNEGADGQPPAPNGDADLWPLRLVTLAEAVRERDPGGLTLVDTPTQDLGPVAETLARALDLVATYETFHSGGPDGPGAFRARISDALSIDLPAGDRPARLGAIDNELRAGLAAISLPGNQSVTLAARRVPIPLTIESRASGPRNVLLRFRSDKVVVTEHGRVITIGPGTSSIDVEVEARSLGESPLEVTVLTPDGRHVLSTTRFRVRSTAVPGLGLAISAVGLAGLAVWWYLSIRRGRQTGVEPAASVEL